MPSPFPGMDPYLENPMNWRGFHTQFIAHLTVHLNRRLPPGFAAAVEERVYLLDDTPGDVYADFAVVRRPAVSRRGGVVVDEPEVVAAMPPLIARLEPVEVRERFIEVLALEQGRQVVTVIEILSPTNKTGRGWEKYRRKQRELRRDGINLLELDLLRAGKPTVLIPPARLQNVPRWDYLLSLYRATQPGQVEFWPVRLRDPIPSVFVPLSSGRTDVTADLQAAFSDTYDGGAFASLLDYHAEVQPPLQADDAEWAATLLNPVA